jgi:molybdopterin biosynthesis enzyme
VVRRSVEVGVAVRRVGDDVRARAPLYPAGTFVTPAVAGVLASVNAAVVSVVPRARVAVLSTGDELIDDGSPLQPGQIRESNRTMLLGAVRDAGCVRSISASCATTRPCSSACCATPQRPAMPSSPAAVSAWATTTW